MRATWYVLEDGTAVDPSECNRQNGVLMHKRGPVAMRRPDCPRSRGVDIDDAAPTVKTEAMQAEPEQAPEKRPTYKRRGRLP